MSSHSRIMENSRNPAIGGSINMHCLKKQSHQPSAVSKVGSACIQVFFLL